MVFSLVKAGRLSAELGWELGEMGMGACRGLGGEEGLIGLDWSLTLLGCRYHCAIMKRVPRGTER